MLRPGGEGTWPLLKIFPKGLISEVRINMIRNQPATA